MNNLNVQQDVTNHIFYVKVKGGTAVLSYEQITDKKLDFKSTHVPEASRGAGVGAHLVESALTYAKERDIEVIPTCPFVKDYIEKHAEFAGVVH